MNGYLGDFLTTETIYVPLHTFNAAGASVTITGLAVTDIEIYKNGSTTQRASDSGYALLDTDGIDFDGITGIHGFSIDLSDNADAGFYTAGAQFWIVVSAITVDSQTVNFVAGHFTIGRLLRPTTAGRTFTVESDGMGHADCKEWLGGTIATPTVTGVPEVDITHVGGNTASYSVGLLNANVTQISGDGTAADNLEAVLDGTGGVTLVASAFTLTTPITANATQISSSATAGTNAKSFFDGTGYAGTGNVIPTVTTLTNLPAVTAGWLTAAGIADNAITAAKIADGAIDAATFAAGAINAAAIAADAITDAKVASDVTIASVTGAVGSVTGAVGSVTGNVGGNVVGSVGSIATGGITTASFAAGAIDAAAMNVTGSEFTAIPWNVAWDTEVQSEVDDALIAKGLDHLVFTSVVGADIADNSIIAYLASKSATADWDSYVNTTDSLEANRDNIGTVGAGLTDLGGMSTTMRGQVQTESEDALVAKGLDHLVSAAVTGTDITDNSIVARLVSASATADWDDYNHQAMSLEAIFDDAVNPIASGTLGTTGNTTTTLHLTGLTYGNDEINDYLIVIYDVSTNEYHATWIDDWADTGDLATVATLPFTPQASTDTYVIHPIKRSNTLTQIGTEVATRLTAIGLDHLVSTSVVGADIADNSIIAYLASKSATADWDSYVNTTDSLEAAADASPAVTVPTTLVSTTIATLSSQTSFTLTAGSADNDAYNNSLAIFVDASTSTQKGVAKISDYVGSTKTVTLAAAPIFTIATTDNVHVIAQPTDLAEILASIATSVVVANPVVNDSTIELIEGDTYDGTRHPKLSWTVAKDYTGTTITLSIWRVARDGTRTIMKTATGTVSSPTLITISTLTASFLAALNYSGSPAFDKLRFALVATSSSVDETIAMGDCIVKERREA